MQTEYSTAEIANHFDLHPNTIRFYEKMGLMPPISRKSNGYRLYTDHHLLHVRLIRTGFQSEILASNLRHQIVDIIKATANGDYLKARRLTYRYLDNLHFEEDNARESILITKELLARIDTGESEVLFVNRQSAADHLKITKNVLREWERSGLLTVQTNSQGHHLYRETDIQRAKIIRTLRSAHYSMIAILRMLNAVDNDRQVDILKVIDTPEDDIIYVTDRFITTLKGAKEDATKLLELLTELEEHHQ
ncbi:MerR family transcriptional regulator [Vagococcus sp. BWB3-3]|uniref:MerR family transcriptional regulator n=1 Tax=Vagococcus allomyrinae TaxID=2794353 RepID=A0A940SYH0_9ENTE|nr:MerR family transcriptional regulator [Vagococcus allomyrinae]MBP1044456.1 MerR family transcriptional regulator [Vagococcus allomyrinae]